MSVHKVEVRSRRLRRHKLSQDDFENSFMEAAAMAPEALQGSAAPEGFRDSFNFAEEMKKKLGIGEA